MIFEKQIINIYKNMVCKRCDDDHATFYFTSEDFEGLNKEEITFKSSLGHNLCGYLYSYENYIPNRLIIFEHGYGGGHLSYMKEIEKLCKAGYLVLSYDHTGCMTSGSDGSNGMAQSLHDLDDCVKYLKSNERFKNLDISVIGHSWGGFSTLNISKIHKDISHVVVMSGFVSVELLIESFFSGLLKGYRKAVLEFERKCNPEYANFHSVDSLLESNAKALLIYSDNDKICSKEKHFDLLKEKLQNKENIHFRLEHNKEHNPNYTKDAVKYLNEYVSLKQKLFKKKKLQTTEEKEKFISSFDWNKMTEQDEKVWDEILSFLK